MTVEPFPPPVWTATRGDTVTVLQFPQPGVLLNVNHRIHWSRRARITRQWRHAAAQAALLLGPPSARAHGPSFVRLIIPVPTRGKRDPGNLYLCTKATVDGLVDAGVWPNDTSEFVETLEPHLVHVPTPKGLVPTVELHIVPGQIGT